MLILTGILATADSKMHDLSRAYLILLEVLLGEFHVVRDARLKWRFDDIEEVVLVHDAVAEGYHRVAVVSGSLEFVGARDHEFWKVDDDSVVVQDALAEVRRQVDGRNHLRRDVVVLELSSLQDELGVPPNVVMHSWGLVES